MLEEVEEARAERTVHLGEELVKTQGEYTRIQGYNTRPDGLHMAAPEDEFFTRIFSGTSSIHLKLSIVFVSTKYLLDLFHLFSTLFVNQFWPISFLNFNLPTLYPLLRVLTTVLNKPHKSFNDSVRDDTGR